ncbi:MAG: carboxypeptidase regulatory-like domain-containing protein [Terriglobales bacterium]
MNYAIVRSLRYWGFALWLLGGMLASAQLDTGGRLRGTITDPSGALVAGAKITLSDPTTSRSRTGTSNERGEYFIPDIPAGSYRLEVEAAGFRRTMLETVLIRLNQTQTINVALALGPASETVTVTGEDGGVVSQQSMLHGAIDPVRLSELPTNARNWTNLLAVVPGVTRASRATGRGTFSSGGSRPTTNQFYVDGGDANDFLLPTTIRTDFLTSGIPVEAIDQFTVITANPTAEYGHSSGAILNAVTRSGSDHLHGSLWEFLRNDALDSRSFFDPPGKKPPLRQHEFGVRMGGPVVPARTFFSAAYSGFRARRDSSLVARVPSDTFFQNAAADPNHNPLLLAVMRAAFPAPDAGTGDPANPNRATAVRVVDRGGNQDSFFLRLDHRLNQRHNLYATLNESDGSASSLSAIPGRSGYQSVRNWFFVTTHQWNITPASLNTFRFSWQRFSYDFPPELQNSSTLEAGRLRTAGPFAGQPYAAANDISNGFPHIDFRFTGLGFDSLGIGPLQPQRGIVPTLLFQDSYSLVRGRHFWKAGGEWRRVHADVELDELIRPVIFLGNATTGDIFLQQQNFHTRDPLRRDRINEVSLFVQDTWRVHPHLSLDLGLRYELNLPMSEADDLQSNMYVMDGDRPVPCRSLPYGAGMQNVALVVPSQHGIRLYCTDKNNLAPRVGFAWDTFGDGKTVLRGAYGIFYDRLFGTMVSRIRFNPPFVLSTSVAFPGLFDGSQAASVLNQTQVVVATTVDPRLRMPYLHRWNLTLARELDRHTALNVSYVGSAGRKLFQTERPNFGATFPDLFRPSQAGTSPPRSQADLDRDIIRPPFGAITARTSGASSDYHGLQVELSRRFAEGFTFTAGYSWAHSLDTISDEDLGLIDSAIPQATLHNLLAGLLVPNSTCGGAATTAASSSVTQARLLAAVRCATGDPSLTVADAGRIFVDRFVSRASPMEGRGDSAFDVRHRFFSSVVYELPFGPGKRFAGQTTGVLRKLLSGWELAGVFESQTGTPLPIFAGVDANRDGDTQSWAVLTGDPASATLPSGIQVTASGGGSPIVRQLTCQSTGSGGALQCVTPFGRGEGIVDPRQRIGRGMFRQQGIWNLDLLLAKRTPLSEHINLQFRAEAFNVLNHVQFGPPTQSISDANFGRIFAQRELAATFFTSGQLSRQIQLGVKFEF